MTQAKFYLLVQNKLTMLDIASNRIKKIENVSHLTELQEFWVSADLAGRRRFRYAGPSESGVCGKEELRPWGPGVEWHCPRAPGLGSRCRLWPGGTRELIKDAGSLACRTPGAD